MGAVEVIYLVAASLWIVVVVTVACIGVRLVLKLRARRRRVQRMLDLVLGRGLGSGVRLDQRVLTALGMPAARAVSGRPRARRKR